MTRTALLAVEKLCFTKIQQEFLKPIMIDKLVQRSANIPLRNISWKMEMKNHQTCQSLYKETW